MNRFSASEAALEGFRLTRERPGAIAAWCGVYFVGMLVIAVVMLRMIDPDLIAMMKAGARDAWDPEAMAEMLVHSAPAFLTVLVMAVFLMSILTAAIYRIILRPEQKSFAYLRLGADELRITAVNLLLFAVGLVCLTCGFLAIRLAGAAGPAVEGLAGVLAICITGWIGVRLSMATPMTFSTRKISIVPAWFLSRGSFWPLLGMITLAVIFYVMVYLLITVISVAVVAVAGGQAGVGAATPTAVVIIGTLISAAMQLILSVVQVVMIYAPFAVAYEQLHGDVSVDPLRHHGSDQT